MSTHVLRFSAALLIGVTALHAEEAAPAATPAPKTEAVAPYELKNRSQFGSVSPETRAPFWPIGWVKRAKQSPLATQAPVVPVAVVHLDEKAFKVTSILIGSGTTPSLAVINGRAYSEGEFLRMPKVAGPGGAPLPAVRVRVQRINDGTVILQNADQTLVASLSRPELSNKKSEELLLDPDR